MAMMPLAKAVFIDKDGTLIYDVPYNVDPQRIQLYPDAAVSLRRLQTAGYRLVVISNQSGVARGYFPEQALADVSRTIREQLGAHGVEIEAFYYCPHIDQDGCTCRKPLPGMLLRAAEELQLDLKDCWMIGDIMHDVQAGSRAGCRSILVGRNDSESQQGEAGETPYYYRVHDLTEAARLIMSSPNERRQHERGDTKHLSPFQA